MRRYLRAQDLSSAACSLVSLSGWCLLCRLCRLCCLGRLCLCSLCRLCSLLPLSPLSLLLSLSLSLSPLSLSLSLAAAVAVAVAAAVAVAVAGCRCRWLPLSLALSLSLSLLETNTRANHTCFYVAKRRFSTPRRSPNAPKHVKTRIILTPHVARMCESYVFLRIKTTPGLNLLVLETPLVHRCA